MRMILKLLFTASLLVLAASQTCTLTEKAKARVTASTCFANLQNYICVLPAEVQDIWATANENAPTNKCFDCANLNKEGLKTAYKAKASGLGQKIGQKNKEERGKFKCLFQVLKAKATEESQTKAADASKNIAKRGVSFGSCASDFIVKVQNRLIKRRRIFCADISVIEAMGIIDPSTTKIGSFKFNDVEAKDIVQNFVNFFTCVSEKASTLSNSEANVQEVLAADKNCAAAASRVLAEEFFGIGRALSRTVDASKYVTEVKTIATAKNTDLYKALSSKVETSFNGSTTINCLPSGPRPFFAKVNEGSRLGKYFTNAVECKEDILIVIENGKVTCEGSCPEDLPATVTAKTDAKNVPTTYYFATGCTAAGAKFAYGSFTNPSDNLAYNFLMYHKGTDHFDSNKTCTEKAEKCKPKKDQAIPADCPQSKIKDECKQEMTSKCAASGRTEDTTPRDISIPYACDYVTQGVEISSDTFVQDCLSFITTKFVTKDNLNEEAIASPEVIISDNEEAPKLRMLATETVTVIPVAQDTTAAITDLDTVVIAPTDVTIDTSETDALNDLNSSGFLSVSLFVLFLLGFLF